MANYSLFGGPTQLQQQLQNIYDDAHEGTLQAVLLETAQQDGPALQAWTLCLFSINAKIKQVENSKPRSDTERGLLNSILELEQECRERIGNLERKKQVSTNPYVTQASLPSLNNLSLGQSSAPVPPSHGASSSNIHNPFQGYDSRQQQPPQVRPYYQTQQSQQSLQPPLQPQHSNPSTSSVNRYNVPRKQVPGSSSNVNTSPQKAPLLDLDLSPGKNDTPLQNNNLLAPVDFDRPKPVVAPVQTQYQYPPQQDFQPVEPEVRKERYEDRSQERQYNSADFTPISAHQRSTSSSSTVYTPVNSRPDLQPLSSASSPIDAPPSPPKREMLKTLRGATSSKKQPSASTANEAPLKGASLAWKFKNFGKSQEDKKPEQPKPAKVKPTRSNAPSVSSQARPNYSTTSVNTAATTTNTTTNSSIPQSTKSNNIKSMLLDDDEPAPVRQVQQPVQPAPVQPAPVQQQQPVHQAPVQQPAPAAHPIHPTHTPVHHSPPPHVTHAPPPTKQTPTAHQATYNALHGQGAARRSGEVRRSGEMSRRSGENRRSGEIRRARPTSGISVRSTASDAGDHPWAGFTSVGSAVKQQQHSNNSSTSSLTSAQTAAAGAGAQKAAQAQQAALAHNRALKPVSSPSTNANANHSAKKPAYQYIVQPTPAKPQQSAATRAALAKSKQLNDRTKAKRQAAQSAQNRTRQVHTPPAQSRPAHHQQHPQGAKQILAGVGGGRQESPSPEEPEEEKKPMTEWDKKVAEIMKDLRGVDENAAKQILNEIVVQGDEVHWEDIAGLEAAKSSLKETVVYPFLRPDLFSGLREPARGMLLFGPPGTGKTMLARAVATESNSTFFSISASSLTSKFLGESEKLVRALFFMAKALAPSIIFVDEIDSLLSQRSDSGEHEASRRIKNEFLVQWSDLASAAAGREREGDVQRVLVLAATNLPWGIDEAARRRFVRRQYIPLPEIETREAQFTKLLAAQRTNLSEEERKGLLQLTEGFSGSDITALTKDAAMGPLRALGDKLLTTSREDIRPIGYQDFISSLAFIRPSVSKEGLKAFEDWAAEYGSSGA